MAEHPEKERLIWTKEPSSAFEKEIASYDVTGDEVLNLIDYTSYFDLMKIPLPDNRSLIFEKLAQEKLIIGNGGEIRHNKFGSNSFCQRY